MTFSRTPAIAFLIAGIAEIAVGAVFLGLGLSGTTGEGSLTFLILGPVFMLSSLIFLAIGRGMLGRYRTGRRLRESGLRGQAVVVSAKPTGVRVNHQPQLRLTLRVTSPGHGVYETSVKEIVPMVMTGQVGSGLPLDVFIDPNDRDEVVIDWDSGFGGAHKAGAFGGGAFGGGAYGAFGGAAGSGTPGGGAAPVAPYGGVSAVAGPGASQAEQIKQHVLLTGAPGVARVLAATFTGQLDEQSRPVYDVQLHVQVDGRPAVSGPGRFGVPPERVSVMQPGGIFPIKVDRHNPSLMAADWDRVPV